eukprot:1298227-Alexandrium_andersonii.AAC.1
MRARSLEQVWQRGCERGAKCASAGANGILRPSVNSLRRHTSMECFTAQVASHVPSLSEPGTARRPAV